MNSVPDASPPGAASRAGVPSRQAVTVIAALAAVLALVLASVGVAEASLWLDESFSVFDARRSLADIWAMRGEAFGGAHHPPGYFLLLRGTMAVCGSDEACVRAPSVLAHGALAAVLAVIAGRLHGRVAAAVAGLGWASLPYAIKYAQQARHYGLLALLAAVALLLVLRAFDARASPPRARVFVALGVVASAALWLHLFALPFLGVLALLVAAAQVLARRWGPVPPARRWGLAAGVAALASAPLLPGLWRVWVTAGGGQLASRAGPVENAGALLVDLASFGLDSAVVPGLCACALLVAGGRARALVLGAVVLAVAPLSVVLVRNPEHFVTLRYFMPSLVPVALLQAVGVAAVVDAVAAARRRWWPRLPPVAAVGVALAVLAWPAWRLGGLHVAGLRKQYATAGFEPWRQVAAAITAAAGEGDVAVFVPWALVRFPFEVYPLPIPGLDPASEAIDAALAARVPGIFVVSSHVDRPARVAERRALLRRISGAGYLRAGLGGVPRQPAIEVVLYRPR